MATGPHHHRTSGGVVNTPRSNRTDTLCAVVIPTHNKRSDVLRCVDAVLNMAEAEGHSMELVVVDDGSTDGSLSALRRRAEHEPRLTVVARPGGGPAAARNAGVRATTAPLVLFVDDDAIPQPGWLSAMLNAFTEPGIVAVEGRVTPTGGQAYGLCGMAPTNESGGVYLTCNFAARRDALVRVGGLDESFPYPAFEDCDLAAVLQALGTIAWAPDAEVHHPCRCWTLRRAVYELRFLAPLVLCARRHGYLGWPDRCTRHPALRAYVAATFTLPVGRVLQACRTRGPGAARYAVIALAQGVAAIVLALPPIRWGVRADTRRKLWL